MQVESKFHQRSHTQVSNQTVTALAYNLIISISVNLCLKSCVLHIHLNLDFSKRFSKPNCINFKIMLRNLSTKLSNSEQILKYLIICDWKTPTSLQVKVEVMAVYEMILLK